MISSCWDEWCRNEKGAAAIEFSLVAVPFTLMVIGIIEVCLLFTAGSLLEGAVYDASRKIRTGQVENSADPEQTFADALCDHAGVLLDCSDFQYDVRVLGTFADAVAVPAPQVDENGNMVDQGFDAGGVSDIIMVRVSYRYPLMTPLIGDIFGQYGGNKRLLVSTTVFQTEPYKFQ